MLGSRLDTIRPVIIGCGLGIWVSSAVMLLGIETPVGDGANPGLFANSNVIGDTAALVLVAALACRAWWLVPGIVPALWIAHCRGAWLALLVALAAYLWRWSRPLSFGLAGVGAIALVYSVEMGSDSINIRATMWGDILPQLTLLGRGLGSFFTDYPLYSSGMDTLATRPEHVHNDWLEFAFELGVGSLFLFAVLWLSRSIVLLVFIVEACTGFPAHMPVTAVVAGIVAGHAVRSRDSLRHDLARRRISLRAFQTDARRRIDRWRAAPGSAVVPAGVPVSQGIGHHARVDSVRRS